VTPPRLGADAWGKLAVTADDVERARRALAPYLRPTPLRRAFCVREPAAWLKLESWQPTGSFKVRGATNVLLSLTEAERARGVAAASAGNHALGVAFATGAVGGSLQATLFVPDTAPAAKVDKLRTFPVRVEQGGATYDDAHARAVAYVRETGATYVHAFDDTRTAAGQGTVGLEILDDLPSVGHILVPVGGGGLISGLAVAVKARHPEVRVIAVQPAASPALSESWRLGRPLYEFPAGPTVADGLAGGIGDLVFNHRGQIDDVVEVSESEIEEAMVALLAQDQVVAEGAGAVGIAALRSGRFRPGDDRPVAVVITGANVDARVLARLLARDV
jgi:threonine dehydratase